MLRKTWQPSLASLSRDSPNKDVLPLFPNVEFLAALVSSGSASGLFWSLGGSYLKERTNNRCDLTSS